MWSIKTNLIVGYSCVALSLIVKHFKPFEKFEAWRKQRKENKNAN